MNAFEALLRDTMRVKGIDGIEELVAILNQVPRREEDPPIEEEEVEAMMRGEGHPHPAFFRTLKEGLELTEDRLMRLAWAYFMGDQDYPGVLPPSLCPES